MSQELFELRSGKLVHRSSCLKALSPFIDSQGSLRVGRRLANAPVDKSFKHPIVLPARSLVSRLIFKYEHIRLMHSGPQALHAHVSLTYWPIRGRPMATQTIRKCVNCFRAQPQFIPLFMAPLPSVRVTVSRPFSNSGVDVCDPTAV